MNLETEDPSNRAILRRKLIVHDAMIIAGLSLVTALLFIVTLLLFRSFESHRNVLAIRWSGRGRAELQEGRPIQAIGALRSALLYAPGDRSYELLLAEALEQAGHTEESYNYFLGLWAAQPGDGSINLWLARLDAKRGDQRAAINYYRAAIYGTWEGDGAARRRDVRMELAQYLLDRKDSSRARTELLIAGGNNPDDAALRMKIAGMLNEASDPGDALSYYEKAISADPRNAAALWAAGRIEYAAGKFEAAHRFLVRADHEFDAKKENKPDGLDTLLGNSQRILELMPAKTLPVRERVTRILAARAIAKKRFEDCSAKLSQSGQSPSSLQILSAAWTGRVAAATRDEMLRDSGAQDATMKLIFDTEVQTSQACGTPGGDDALLLLLAQSQIATDE